MTITQINSNRFLPNMPPKNLCKKMFREVGAPVQNGEKESPAVKLFLSSKYKDMETLRFLFPDSKGKLRKKEATLEYAAKIKEQAEKQKRQLPSGNLREKMMEVSREFIRQYTNQGMGICVKDFIQTITLNYFYSRSDEAK